MLIDQSDEDMDSIKRMLSGENISVKIATDLDMGLSLINQGADIIIMDLYLPYSHGYDTFEVVRDYSATIPIIVLTENQDKDLALKAIRYGAQDYLFKETINGEVLVRSIRYAIERKMLVEEQKAIKFGLSRSSTDVEQFTYVAANDLSHLLDSVLEQLQLFKSDLAQRPPAKSTEGYNIAQESATTMRGIIDDLFGFSRVVVEGRPFERFSVEEALLTALDELRSLIDRTGAAVTHDPLPTIIGDRSQITLLLRNLIDTAIRFRGKGPLQIRVSTREDPKVWAFSVKDNGTGTPESLQDLVSGDFNSMFAGVAAKEHPGAGIKLIISKRVVERHGGIMKIVSVAEKGTATYFTIPKEYPG
ncbi:MAG: response regulator [Methanomassiliicoccus sp.]|nr:response regulator [Methanomassiliicoccus sp.]